MKHTRVAVLRGGPSSEYDVSMMTGAKVLETLRESPNFFAKDVVITRHGEWLVNGRVRTPEQVLLDMDVAFVALHGPYGEDGTVQRILEQLSVPYTGSGPFASGLAMSKTLTKSNLKNTGIKMPKHMRLSRDGVTDIVRTAQSIATLFGPHYFIKPERGGSSISTYLVKSEVELPQVIEKALAENEFILVEERIFGKEATVGVIENYREQPLYQLPAIEIIPPSGSDFFAAEVKYTGETQEVCPGNFSRSEKDELLSAAKKVHETLGLRHYSRSDFIVNNDGVFFLEVNTLPGLTPESLFPKAIDSVGGTYNELVCHLITLAETKSR